MLLLLLIPSIGGFLLEKDLFHQANIADDSLTLFNYTGISHGCQNDMQIWLKSILHFAGEFDSCILRNSTNCTQDTKNEMKKNLYGLKQLDAFGRTPSGVLDIKTTAYGDLQECQEVSTHFYYPTKYCFIHSEIAQKGKEICAADAMLVFKTAVCMPKSCSEKDILSLAKQRHRLGVLDHCSVACKKDEGTTNALTWIYLSFMSILVAFLIVSSILDFILETYYNLPNKNIKNTILRSLLTFSIYTNGGVIWNTSPPREGHLKCLDCIRFLSMLWVASGHVFNFMVNNDTVIPMLAIPRPILVDTLMSAFFSVDTFLVLSGLLVSYMFFKAVGKNPQLVKNPLTWVMFYVHRYLRLTPPYMLFICWILVVTPLLTGILMSEWDAPDTLVNPCQEWWWKSLLYINNFNNGSSCYGITWYLAVDQQLFWVSPLFLMAFYFSVWLGLGAVALSCLGSSIATIILTIHYNLPATAARPEESQHFQEYLYQMPWIRCPPYLMGIAAGYFLAKYPKWKPKVHWVIPFLGWILTVALALTILYAPHDYLALETNWPRGIRGLYNAGGRIGWAIFVIWVIMANQYGYGGPVAPFMEHPIWQPLGRLSYTAYLCHMFLIIYLWNLQDRPLHFTGVWSQFIKYTQPVVVMAYFFAFFWSCLTEIPFGKLEKMLFGGIMPKKVENKQKKPEQDEWDDEHF